MREETIPPTHRSSLAKAISALQSAGHDVNVSASPGCLLVDGESKTAEQVLALAASLQEQRDA